MMVEVGNLSYSERTTGRITCDIREVLRKGRRGGCVGCELDGGVVSEVVTHDPGILHSFPIDAIIGEIVDGTVDELAEPARAIGDHTKHE